MKRPQKPMPKAADWTQSGRHLEEGEPVNIFETLVGVAVLLFAAVVWLIALGV